MSLRTCLITMLGGSHPLYVQIAEDTVEKLTLANKHQEDQLHMLRRTENALLARIVDGDTAFPGSSIADGAIERYKAGKA